MAKQAGIFKAPPAMFEEIREWMWSVYAGHILAGIEPEIKKARDAMAPIRDAIKDNDAALAELKKAGNLAIGKAIKFRVHGYSGWTRGVNSGLYGIKRVEDSIDDLDVDGGEPRYRLGAGEKAISWKPRGGLSWDVRGDIPLDKAQTWLRSHIERGNRELNKKLENPTVLSEDDDKSDTTLVELTLLSRAISKFTTKSKSYSGKTKRKFDVDITGWGYVEDEAAAKKALKEAKWDKITAFLDFKGTQYKGGHWNGTKKELLVEVGIGSTGSFFYHPGKARTVKQFKNGLAEIARTLRHEMQHVGQDLLRVIKDLEEDAGLPGRAIRPEGYAPSGVSEEVDESGKKHQLVHPLRDVEFYTRLADEVEKFVSKALPLMPKDMRQEALRVWVGASPKTELKRPDGETVSAIQQFFFSLKKYQPDKWRKAVKEFTKQVNRKAKMATLRRRVVRLAYNKPALRASLLDLLRHPE